jgi:YHS domain-containing protein
MVKDVVCGMEVDEKKALFVSFNGKKYFFCSKACEEKFSANPEKYSGN